MFTFKPSAKNGSNGSGNGNGNGHSNGNGNGNGNGHAAANGNGQAAVNSNAGAVPNGNGHTAPNGNGHAAPNGSLAANGNGGGATNGNGHSTNGNGQARSPLTGWFGLGGKPAQTARNGNGHANGNSNKIESVLGPGIAFQGSLTGVGGVRIEGTLDGSVNVKGPVVVADGARVTADIHAYSVSVGGTVQGNITAGKVEIRATGRIFGDLVTTAFSTEEGAFLRGQVRMEDEIPAPAQLQLAAPVPATALVEPAPVSEEATQTPA